MDRIPRLPAFVRSFSVFFLLVCFVAVLGVVLRYQWHSIFFCLSLFMRLSCSYSFKMKHDNRSFVCYFYLEFLQTKRSKGICTRLTVGKKLCLSFGRRKHIARHRNYRLVLSLRSRYRQKKNVYRPKITAVWHYRRIITAIFWFYHLRQSLYRQKTKTAYRQNITAVWHYRRKVTVIFWFYRLRQSCYRQKTKNRLPPKNYRRMALPPRLCSPIKA